MHSLIQGKKVSHSTYDHVIKSYHQPIPNIIARSTRLQLISNIALTYTHTYNHKFGGNVSGDIDALNCYS